MIVLFLLMYRTSLEQCKPPVHLISAYSQSGNEMYALYTPSTDIFHPNSLWLANWPSGKASVSGAGDRRFESCIGR